ncbi:hypothetical protein MNBD_NITROSPINAE03-1809 [hydrothermal vent metagenome]|uniref:Response regulatory domain-containing protein n=1 Tax=hydrothermal vent metagenome TaxID=652676 RepID=A0A3B1CHN1_9ZZZZ
MVANKSRAQMKILIIDGHETSRHVIAILLHKLGFKNILEAKTKAEAEKIIEEHTRKSEGMSALVGGGGGSTTVCDLDLVILDKDVPPDSGMIYLAQLRHQFDAGSLPVLFTAMKDGADQFSLAGSAGANDTLVKPFTHERLSAKIEPLLGGGKAPVIQSFSFGGGGGAGAAGAKKEQPKPGHAKSGAPSSVSPEKPAPPSDAKPSVSAPKKRKEKPKLKAKAGGVSFQRRDAKKVFTEDDPVTATLKDGKIDSLYHVDVDVIGGGENCFWATQEDGRDMVKLYYLTAKGKSTGMLAKEIGMDEFMHTFYLCEEYGCGILDRL